MPRAPPPHARRRRHRARRGVPAAPVHNAGRRQPGRRRGQRVRSRPYAQLVAADPAANLVVSPASIALALAMARAGAKGPDRRRDGHRHARSGATRTTPGSRPSIRRSTARRRPSRTRGTTTRKSSCASVNAPFAQRGFALEPAYLEALASRFGCRPAARGLHGRPGGGARRRSTRGSRTRPRTASRSCSPPAPSTADHALVLVNAIYLKAAWQTSRSPRAPPRPAPFTRLDGTTMSVEMMRTGGWTSPTRRATGWQAVELPYVGGQLAMLVIVPDDLAAFEASSRRADLADITGTAGEHRREPGLPEVRHGVPARLG